MYSDRSLVNKQNVTSNAKNSYKANRDFLMTIIKSRVSCWCHENLLALRAKVGNSENFPLPKNPDAVAKAERLSYHLELSAKIVDGLDGTVLSKS